MGRTGRGLAYGWSFYKEIFTLKLKGVGAKEFGQIFSQVTYQLEQWADFAEQAGVGSTLTQAIQKAIEGRRRAVG